MLPRRLAGSHGDGLAKEGFFAARPVGCAIPERLVSEDVVGGGKRDVGGGEGKSGGGREEEKEEKEGDMIVVW